MNDQDYAAVFLNLRHCDFLLAQRELTPVHIPSEHVIARLSLPISEIFERIRYSRMLVNNLSVSRNESAINRLEYGDGTFIDYKRVLELLESHASIVIRAAERFFPSIEGLMASIQRPWQCEAQANLYMSRAAVCGTPPHFDPHELFVFQVYGEKQWLLYESRYKMPETDDGYDDTKHGHGVQIGEVTLRQGDVLFLPRGIVHKPTAVHASVHVSIGLKPISYSQLLARLLQVATRLDPAFRSIALQADGPFDMMQCKNLLLRLSGLIDDHDLFSAVTNASRVQYSFPDENFSSDFFGDLRNAETPPSAIDSDTRK